MNIIDTASCNNVSFCNDPKVLLNSGQIKKEPLRGLLGDYKPLIIKIASRSPLEPLWDYLMRTYHYLGYQRLLGHSLKYLVFFQDRPVAALSFSAAALKVRVRDSFIGWSQEQRKAHLKRVVNNSRFLILPWISIDNLASHVLSSAVRQLVKDWPERFTLSPWLIETYVDPVRFKGTCYKAANWRYIGTTGGFGKRTPGYVYHGCMKEVYTYVLESDFRDRIGCYQRPYSFMNRPASLLKIQELQMLVPRKFSYAPEIIDIIA